MTYDRIRITPKLTVHAHSTVERFTGGVVVTPPGATDADKKYFRGEVGDALMAYMDGSVNFPINNRVLDIYQGWTERRVAQDTMAGWESPKGVEIVDPESPEPRPRPGIPRLDMAKVRKIERGL